MNVDPCSGSANGAEVVPNQLLELLQNVANGVLSAQDAAVQLNTVASSAPFSSAEASPAATRADFPEVVWGDGKAAPQIATNLQRIAAQQGISAATRVDAETAAQVLALLPDVTYNDVARCLLLKSSSVRQQKLPGTVALITAGTACPRVVEECRVMLQATGCYCFKLPESGVMGMHRIVANLDAVRAADVIICVTGMDGGITSVVAGMVESPVIALPTSTGYGTAFGGVAPLLAALNSSAPGVLVVNIDSGFGAAMAAWRLLKNAAKIRKAMAPPGVGP